MEPKQCPVCGTPSDVRPIRDIAYQIDCARCGLFEITSEARSELETSFFNPKSKTANLSGWINEHQNQIINTKDLERLTTLKTPSVGEKANKLMKFISKKIPIPGDELAFDLIHLGMLLKRNEEGRLTDISIKGSEHMLEALAASWSQDESEIGYLLNEYLGKRHNLISGTNRIKITPDGWAYLEKLNERNLDSNIGFIAMKFNDDLKAYSDKWFEPAILNAGYKPIRIDKYQHNNLIDDEIIANIRRSRFVVADFTENSYGVYYEAGFAKGLNIKVICLCRKDYFDEETNKVHFDTNHYSFILWEFDKGEELKKQLQYRIEATIGIGNYKAE